LSSLLFSSLLFSSLLFSSLLFSSLLFSSALFFHFIELCCRFSVRLSLGLPRYFSYSYPLDRRLGWPQSPSGRGGEEKNSQSPPEIEPWNPDSPARCPALYRLSHHGSCFTRISNLILQIFYKNSQRSPIVGAHPASYPMGTRGSFPEGKAAGT
jgi:hypothetical protein